MLLNVRRHDITVEDLSVQHYETLALNHSSLLTDIIVNL